MKMIIHDLTQHEFESLQPNVHKDTVIISDKGSIKNCIGCFGCWIKTPGVCVLKDGYHNMGVLLSKCSELLIISKCLYGSYSPFVRNVIDRCIPYVLPYFVQKNGETHHKNRYANTVDFSVHFYGDDISQNEQETAKKLVSANGVNFYFSGCNTYFHNSLQDIGGLII